MPSNNEFLRLYGQLGRSEIGIPAFLERLGSLEDDYSEDLLRALEEQVGHRNWRMVDALIIPIHWRPSRIFTPVLCKLLDQHRSDVNIEDVAETLYVLRDERATPCVVAALNHFVPGDEDFHFNRKCIRTLCAIGTPEAIEVVNQMRDSPEDPIRDEAMRVLARRQN